jgi:hypothetical protein
VKLLLALVLALNLSLAQSQIYVQVNGVSVHDRPGFNSVNYGAGVEQTVTDRWSVAGGWYRNSEYRSSVYGYARYSIYKNGPWDIGIGAGAVTGYQRMNVMPMAFPEVCYSYLCAIALPQVDASGASALAVHLRLPIN